MMKNKSSNMFSLVLCIISTYIMSVSIGLNSVIIPLFMENNEALFSEISTTIILSAEAFCAIALCIIFFKVIRIFGLKGGVFVSIFMRFLAILALGFWPQQHSWLILTIFLGAGSFTYLILMQIWVNNIKFTKFKGVIYSIFGTAISLGIATGPFIYNQITANPPAVFSMLNELYTDITPVHYQFILSALISILALAPFIIGLRYIPKLQAYKYTNIFSIIKNSKGVLFAVALCGVSFFGVAWYITIYGVRNGLTMFDASILLSAYMIGSVCLDAPITWLSEYINRKYMLVYCALLCTIFAIFLPLAIYEKYQAYALLFVWGGVISSMYSNCLFLMEEKYGSDKSISAMAAFSFMENAGAAAGLIIIGILLSISTIGTDGFSYVIMLASIVYFTFALTRYKVQAET